MADAHESDYGSQHYWDNLYATRYANKTFDWYQDYETLSPFLCPHLLPEKQILMIGCGNSTLSTKLYDNGFKHITNVDYSPTVIAYMSEQCKSLKEMTWLCMDATKMSFGDSSIESAVDKGTLDSIMCRLDSADLAPVFFREVHRVLKPGAKFLVISFDEDRDKHLSKEQWSVGKSPITFFDTYHGEEKSHWVYVLTKK